MAILGVTAAAMLGATPAASEGRPDSPAFLPSRPASDGVMSLQVVRQKIVEIFDVNGDRRLDSDERGALRDRARRWALSRFDDDGDGRLSPRELEALKRALGGDNAPAKPLPTGAVEI